MGSQPQNGGTWLYALEVGQQQGPWEVPEQLKKLNGVLRYNQGSRYQGWSLTGMVYQADWRSTDQVPQRALDQGLIGRYGSLDHSDGGKTYRYSLSGEWSNKTPQDWSRGHAYVMDYGLNLWSNFTFCTLGCGTKGPGDQFEQEDRRTVYGGDWARTWYTALGDSLSEWTVGVQSRYDMIKGIGLYTTTARQRWGTVRQDQVKQGNLGLYGESMVEWHQKFRTVLGLRQDFYHFDVNSALSANSGRVDATTTSPKLSLIFGPWQKTEYYLNWGYGFHSNDARGITTKINPDFRDTDPTTGFGKATTPSTPLVRAKAYELGVRSGILPGLQTSLALWRLELASELLFVGDAGTTEPSFPSRRVGLEWANYWTPTPSLVVDMDWASSQARYTSVAAANQFIPGAIERTASLGLSYQPAGPWAAGFRWRYFGPRPLVEDNSVRSPASLLANGRISYRVNRELKWSLDVLNLFNRQVSDIDYFYASQMRSETSPVDDIHTHPAEPRTVRFSVSLGL
jgi:outer membrane receptor for monomeric catechols